MNVLDISMFPHALVEFQAHSIRGAKTLWMNSNDLASTNESKAWDPDGFSKTFAVGVSGTPCFQNLSFDTKTSVRLFAERYGGVGSSGNGGGSRCGNLGGFQLKGVGRNCLVGAGKNVKHSYGGLVLVEAVMEAICSVAFGRILPMGANQCFGLILTGRESAFRFGV